MSSRIKNIEMFYSQEEAKVYFEERRGPYVARLQLSPDVGLYSSR